MKKLLIVLFLAFSILFSAINPLPSLAAKAKVTKAMRARVGTKLSQGNVNLTFSNLGKVKKISYQLTYNRSGIQDGVGGILSPKTKSLKKSILLGSCSTGNVCVMHKGISNIKLKIIASYSNGLSETMSYKIK